MSITMMMAAGAVVLALVGGPSAGTGGASSLGVPAGGVEVSRAVPMHSKASCDRQMEKGAKACSRKIGRLAALCHAANTVRYASCLAGADG